MHAEALRSFRSAVPVLFLVLAGRRANPVPAAACSNHPSTGALHRRLHEQTMATARRISEDHAASREEEKQRRVDGRAAAEAPDPKRKHRDAVVAGEQVLDIGRHDGDGARDTLRQCSAARGRE